MERTVSKTKALDSSDRDILRAIYYRQNLRRKLVAMGTGRLHARLQVLEIVGYVRTAHGKLELTDAGTVALHAMYGGRKPPMIDFYDEATLDVKSKKKQLVVGSSLARKLANEISSGE